MRAIPYLFELSGEHPTLPFAELDACVRIAHGSNGAVGRGLGFAIYAMSEKAMLEAISRLALTHRAGEYLGSCYPGELEVFLSRLRLGPGSVAVRVKRFGGQGSPSQANDTMRRVGEVISRTHRIDLTRPDHDLRIFISDRFHFHVQRAVVDRDQYERRHVRSRPFFSPVSLHPRYARALVNLTMVKKGDTLLDPFCGTGGILLEAAMVGARAIGSDASKEMVQGCRANLGHFEAEHERLEVLDIGEVPDAFHEVDAVATDPPYGRSASTMREPVRELHDRGLDVIGQVLKEGGRAGVVLPYACSGRGALDLEEAHVQRVHRSLDRHYCILRKRAA